MKKKLLIFTVVLSLTVVHNFAIAQYTKLLDFNGTNGLDPNGALVSNGTFLYGMTRSGGSSYGNIFKTKWDGTGYSNMYNFSLYPDGEYPCGSLIFDGTFLYGMTSFEGYPLHGAGTVFKIKPDGSGKTILLSFAGSTNVCFPNGAMPLGSLFYDGTYLYGMTAFGGASSNSSNSGDGTIFRIKTDGSGDTILFSFTGTNGNRPYGSLISDGTFLYGMTTFGGVNNIANGGDGTIFKIKPDGTGFSKLLDFANDTVHGTNPYGSLIFDGTFFYGMTSGGGTKDMGTIFKIKPDGSGYVKLFDFTGTNGSTPKGSLIFDKNYLYGMSYNGGTNNMGVIFRINPEGCWYSKLLDFSGVTNGANPSGDLLSDGTFLYGITSGGGINNDGTMFKILIPNNIITQSATICTGQNITVGSHTYSITGTYMDTLTSFVGCGDSLVTTHLTVLSSSSASSTQTLTICSGQSVAVGTDNYTTSGTYTFTFQGGGCDSTVTTSLTVNPSPTISISGSTAICIGNSTTLTASGGGNYIWSTGSTANSIIVSPTTAETYSVIATLGSCSDTSSVLITVDHPPVAVFNSSFIICCPNAWVFTDSSFTALSDTITSWNWNLPGGFPSHDTVQNANTTYPAVGFYTVCLTVTTTHGCTDSVCHTINVLAMSVNNKEIESSITISPNPFSSQTTLQTDKNLKDATLIVYNLYGQKVKEIKNISGQSIALHRDNLPSGLYFIRLSEGNKIFATEKLIITDK